jgi:hypothetical protein
MHRFSNHRNPFKRGIFMENKTAKQSAAKKFSPSRIVKTMTETLMIKTGIKSGPEATFGPY